jgi:hypothetical protein
MKLKVNKDQTAGQISEQFSEAFPGLKIAVVTHHHDESEGSPKKDILPDSTVLGSAHSRMKAGEVELDNSMSVGEVEKVFEEKLNIPIQIFVQLGNAWIETTATDHYTLQQQMQRHQERK